MTQTTGWILSALLILGTIAVADAQVPTGGSQPKRTTGTPTGGISAGKTNPGAGPVRTNPSANPFENPIMQPIPPATSTVNPQQNYPGPALPPATR